MRGYAKSGDRAQEMGLAEVAKQGFEAMQSGEAQVIAGLKTLEAAIVHVTPVDKPAKRSRNTEAE